MWSLIFDRLHEKNTWHGLNAFVGGIIGVSVGPEYIDVIIEACIAVSGVVEVIFRQHGYITNKSKDDSNQRRLSSPL